MKLNYKLIKIHIYLTLKIVNNYGNEPTEETTSTTKNKSSRNVEKLAEAYEHLFSTELIRFKGFTHYYQSF